MFSRGVAAVALVLMAGVACVTTPAAPTSVLPVPALQVSPVDASPGTSIRLRGGGFNVAEYVEVRVTDPDGAQTRLGRVIADGRGAVDAQVAPGQDVMNGVSVVSLSGTVSGLTASAPINVTGGSDGDPVTGEPQWTLSTASAESSCEQCLLVHGQAP